MISSCGLLSRKPASISGTRISTAASQSATSRLPGVFCGPLYKKNPPESPELLKKKKLNSQEGGYEKYEVSFFHCRKQIAQYFSCL